MRYKHDCDICEFVGEQDEYDVYWCSLEPTIVMRRSSEPSDYLSSESLIDKITEPKVRARLVRRML
jgi:hypothetical protein